MNNRSPHPDVTLTRFERLTWRTVCLKLSHQAFTVHTVKTVLTHDFSYRYIQEALYILKRRGYLTGNRFGYRLFVWPADIVAETAAAELNVHTGDSKCIS